MEGLPVASQLGPVSGCPAGQPHQKHGPPKLKPPPAPEQAWSTLRARNGGTAGAFGGAAAGAGGAGDAGAAGAGDGGVLSPSDCPARELFLSLYSGGPALVDGQCCYSLTVYCG